MMTKTTCLFTKMLCCRGSIVLFIALTLLQQSLHCSARSRSSKRRLMTLSNSRGRRQTISNSSESIFIENLIPRRFDLTREHAFNYDSSRGGFCPPGCRCESRGSEIECQFLYLTSLPPYLPAFVEKLNLGHNSLSTLPASAFNSSTKYLKTVSLQNNYLVAVDGVFTGLLKLEVLRLSWNRLSAIRKTTFWDLKGLKRLYLDHNRLSFVHPEFLRGLINLSFLRLDGNRLTQLHPDTFVTLRFNNYFRYSHIRHLYLSNNQFQILHQALLEKLNDLEEIYLDGNPWDCSCQIHWIHQWLRRSRKLRCQRLAMRTSDPWLCPLCATPFHLKGETLVNVTRDHITCSPPRMIGQELYSTTEMFPEDQASLKMESQALLFRHSAAPKPSFSLELASQFRSMLLHCNSSGSPSARTEYRSDAYVGTFQLVLDCTVEHPTERSSIQQILHPYLRRSLILNAPPLSLKEESAMEYDVEMEHSSRFSEVDSKQLIHSATLRSDFELFKSPQASISLIQSRFFPERGQFTILYQTTVTYTLDNGPTGKNFPWAIAGDPSALQIRTKLAIEGQTVMLRCKAMGFPKPELSWVIPDGTRLRPGNRLNRLRVTSRGSRLIIHRPSKDDEGIYRCLSQAIQRDHGSLHVAEDIGSLRLYIIPFSAEPLFPHLVQNISVEKEVNWSHPCAAEPPDYNQDDIVSVAYCQAVPQGVVGWVTPDYQLKTPRTKRKQQNGVAVDENGSIAIRNINKNNNGVYRCVVANRVAASEISIRLNIVESRNNYAITSQLKPLLSAAITISTQLTTSTAVTSSYSEATTPPPTTKQQATTQPTNITITQSQTTTTTHSEITATTHPTTTASMQQATTTTTTTTTQPETTVTTESATTAATIATQPTVQRTTSISVTHPITTKTTTATVIEPTTLMSMPQPTALTTETIELQPATTTAQASSATQTQSTTALNTTRVATIKHPTSLSTAVAAQLKTAITAQEPPTLAITHRKTSTKKATQPLTKKTTVEKTSLSNSTATKLKPTTYSYAILTNTTKAPRSTTLPSLMLKVTTTTTTNKADFSTVDLQTVGHTDINLPLTPNDSLEISGILKPSLEVITLPTGTTNLMEKLPPSGDLGLEGSKANVCNGIPCDSKFTLEPSHDKGLICCRRQGVFSCCPGTSSTASPVTSSTQQDDLDVSKKVELINLKPEVKSDLSKKQSLDGNVQGSSLEVQSLEGDGLDPLLTRSTSHQQIVRIQYGTSFALSCPFTSGIIWKFYPRLTPSSRQSGNIFAGVFSQDGEIEFLSFQNPRNISISKATSVHNGTFQCLNGAFDFYRFHVFVMGTPQPEVGRRPRITRPVVSKMMMNYGSSITIPCSAEGVPAPEVSWSWPTHRSLAARVYAERNELHIEEIPLRVTDGFLRQACNQEREIAVKCVSQVHNDVTIMRFELTIIVAMNDISTTRPRCRLFGKVPPKLDLPTVFSQADYVCTSRNQMGEVRHQLRIIVNFEKPEIKERNQSVFAKEGDKVGLDCHASGVPSPRVKWILPDGQTVTTDNPLENAAVLSQGRLVLPEVRPSDRGKYTCIASSPVGEARAMTSVTVLPSPILTKDPAVADTRTTKKLETTAVKEEDEEEYLQRYRITRRLRNGETAFLPCRTHFPRQYDVITPRSRHRFSYRRRRFRFTARWTTPSGDQAAFPYPIPTWRHRVYMNATLRIQRVSTEDSGLYVCVAQDRRGRKIRTSVQLIVATQAPVLEQTLHQVVEVSKNRAAWAPCSASGYPKPTIRWKSPQGRTYSPGSFGNGIRVFSSGKLMLYGVTSRNAGTYTCTARNEAGSVTRVVVFKLRNFAPIIRGVRSTTQHVRLGGSVRLSCAAKGEPDPYIYWTMPHDRSIKQNEGLFQSGYSRSKLLMQSSGTLSIRRATHYDAGYYHCYATNRMGEATKTVHLKVYY